MGSTEVIRAVAQSGLGGKCGQIRQAVVRLVIRDYQRKAGRVSVPQQEIEDMLKKDSVYEGVTGGEVIRASNRQLAKQMFSIFSKRVTDKEDSNKIKRSK